jgi:hypothetical protein
MSAGRERVRLVTCPRPWNVSTNRVVRGVTAESVHCWPNRGTRFVFGVNPRGFVLPAAQPQGRATSLARIRQLTR